MFDNQSSPPRKRSRRRYSTSSSLHSSGYKKFSRNELIRLLIQSLKSLGLEKSASTLENESGIQLSLPEVDSFSKAFVNGDWDMVESLFNILSITDEESCKEYKFLIARQKYLELIERGNYDAAILLLRKDITPLKYDSEVLRNLSSFIMCMSPEQLRKNANWMGDNNMSRQILLEEIQCLTPPHLILRPHRLEMLLNQAMSYQRIQCMYHRSDSKNFSLYSDHVCDRDSFPHTTIRTLVGHQDEVWHIQFSNNGEKLASASKDGSCIIWNVQIGSILQKLTGHADSVSFISWSPNDKFLLTCGSDSKAKLWRTEGGVCSWTISRHEDSLTSSAWFQDSRKFLTGSVDQSVYMWNIDGSCLYRWSGIRCIDMALSSDCSKMITICQDKKIRVYDIETKREITTIQESDPLTSLSISRDSNFALVNLSSQELHLWDLNSKILVRRFVGQSQAKYIIRSCFGGVDQEFVVSGSEDGKVYIWRRDNGQLVESLEGHLATVNTVAWNPRQVTFASGSDDRSIRIWGLEDYSSEEQPPSQPERLKENKGKFQETNGTK